MRKHACIIYIYKQTIHTELHILQAIDMQDTRKIHSRYMQYICEITCMLWALAVRMILVLLWNLRWSEGFGTMTMPQNRKPLKKQPYTLNTKYNNTII